MSVSHRSSFLSAMQSTVGGDSQTSASHLDQSLHEDASKAKHESDMESKEAKVIEEDNIVSI